MAGDYSIIQGQSDSQHSAPLTPEVLVPYLGNYLVEKGLITETDLQKALLHQDFTPFK